MEEKSMIISKKYEFTIQNDMGNPFYWFLIDLFRYFYCFKFIDSALRDFYLAYDSNYLSISEESRFLSLYTLAYKRGKFTLKQKCKNR